MKARGKIIAIIITTKPRNLLFSDSPPSFTTLALYASRPANYSVWVANPLGEQLPTVQATLSVVDLKLISYHGQSFYGCVVLVLAMLKNRAYNPVRPSPAAIKSSKSARQQTQRKRSPKTFNSRDLSSQTDFHSLDDVSPQTPSATRAVLTSRTKTAFNFWDSPPPAATQRLSTKFQAPSTGHIARITSFDFGSGLLPRLEAPTPALPFRPGSYFRFEDVPESSTTVSRPIQNLQNLPSSEISAPPFCFTAVLPSRPDNLFKLLTPPQAATLQPSTKGFAECCKFDPASPPRFSTSWHAGLGLAALFSARD
ncbi:hypothetical protein B0H16DRAFT_1788248 [Mycena metata]|uniref:Uncharacterized protein n=1 Tax=Mycena metata TaxID=1033252 RepID=A0AAD7HKN1_9AGAR|nr:hypothetical protein B0H16DRAFT_1788248 [Mycena metata]